MPRPKQRITLTAALRKAIQDAPSLLGISKATGVQRATLSRFRDGRQSLRLDIADILAGYFEIEVRPPARKRRTR